MRIALAPDSFKGSLSAPEVCRALQNGAARVFPGAHFVSIPLADGGEGTLDALVVGAGGRFKTCVVRGPLGAAVEARWGILPDGRAVIEMAEASGLGLIEATKRDALAASSHGTGQLIRAALDAGCRSIALAIGDSATTDGGLGALNALGLYARDDRERALKPGGAGLAALASLDAKFLDARLQKTEIAVLCDVDNPLCGPRGAAHVYAAQKGASEQQVEQLDAALRHYAMIAARWAGADYSDRAGAGAAGGLGFGLLTFCKAHLQAGAEVVLEALGFTDRIAGCDLILTGEGAIDAQTLNGKTIAGVCQIARQSRVPVIAIGGAVKLSGAQMDELGLLTAFSLANEPSDLNYCLRNAADLVALSTERALRLWRATRQS